MSSPWPLEAVKGQLAAEKAKFLYDQHRNPSEAKYIDPVTRSFLDGVPRINYRNTMRILQSPGQVVIINEYNHTYRVIPIDGSPHIGGDIKLWMGDSRGHWEGNTLVVDVTNNNEHTWFDIVGSFHSDALRVVERWTFVNPDRIDYEATIEDPKVFARPWKILVNLGRREDYELWEYAIWEGSRSGTAPVSYLARLLASSRSSLTRCISRPALKGTGCWPRKPASKSLMIVRSS